METKEKATTARKSVYQIVTDRIIELLEKGTVPWKKPWTEAGLPMNLISKKPYRGMNVLLLNALGYEINCFITGAQLKELGGTVKKGEKSHMVVFWNWPDKKKAAEATEETVKPPVLRYYQVFNVAQCEGIPEKYIPEPPLEAYPIGACEKAIEQMPNPPKLTHKERFAFYNPLTDEVNVPKLNQFTTEESYYATTFHELAHATGHPKRLNRKGLLEMAEYGNDAYSFEELVAEMTSAFLLFHCGIEAEQEQNASYIQSWIAKLKSDNRLIIQAAALAQKAADYILGIERGEYEEKETEATPS